MGWDIMYTFNQMADFSREGKKCLCGHTPSVHFWTVRNNKCIECSECLGYSLEDTPNQTDIPYAFHLMPYDALLAIAHTLKEGEKKYGRDNWKKISIEEHKNHEITHSYLGLNRDTSDNHYVNAACRALFALQLEMERKKNNG